MAELQTEFAFTLPRGYVDEDGQVHKSGVMRLATAMDEIAPLRDPRVQQNEAYLILILLSRVISRLGSLTQVTPNILESMFTADLAYLQRFYGQINEQGSSRVVVQCPECSKEMEVDLSSLGG